LKIKLVNVIKNEHSVKEFFAKYKTYDSRILNIGSGPTTSLNHCTNLDIQKKHGVGILGDANNLPFRKFSFDICILSAVLQYRRNPYKVVDKIYRVLKHNGHVYIDAPFIQPYCCDTPDLFRFTKDALLLIFGSKFSIQECDASISAGSALAFYCRSIVGNSNNRYLNYIKDNGITCIVTYLITKI
jgi:SAM-dependent methyltransferase